MGPFVDHLDQRTSGRRRVPGLEGLPGDEVVLPPQVVQDLLVSGDLRKYGGLPDLLNLPLSLQSLLKGYEESWLLPFGLGYEGAILLQVTPTSWTVSVFGHLGSTGRKG